MIVLDSYSRQVFNYLDPILIYISLWIDCLFDWNSQKCSMIPLAFIAGSFQGHWLGFNSRNYTEHQWKVTTDSRTLNTGAHLDLSGQRIAVCSALFFVVYSPMNRYYRKRCSSHMNAQYHYTNEHQIFPLSSVGTCQVVVAFESLSLVCSIWWNNRKHFDGVFKEYLSGIHLHVCFWK